jgi:hypothetical protein
MATGKTAKKVARKQGSSRRSSADYVYVIFAKNKSVTVVSRATGELKQLSAAQLKYLLPRLKQRQKLGEQIAAKLKSSKIDGLAIEDCSIIDGHP